MIKILAIGNSFSQDATALLELFDLDLYVRNLYIPGCPLSYHSELIKTKEPAYRELSRVIDIRLTPVKKGELAGCYDIRIYGMKREPTSTIIYDILNFIFS